MISVLDTYGMNIPILILALCECIAVGWVFGTDNMSLAIEVHPSTSYTSSPSSSILLLSLELSIL